MTILPYISVLMEIDFHNSQSSFILHLAYCITVEIHTNDSVAAFYVQAAYKGLNMTNNKQLIRI